MNKKYQCGAIRASVFINFLLGAGVVGAVLFVLFSNMQQTVSGQSFADKTAARTPSTAPPAALTSIDEDQIEKLKSALEIETLILERLRIQTETVRASQRRAQSDTPDNTSPALDQTDTIGLGNNNSG